MRQSRVILIMAITSIAAAFLCQPSFAGGSWYIPGEIAVDGSGNVYTVIGPGAVDEGIYVFAPDGRLTMSYKASGYTDLAIGPDGSVYASNLRTKQVVRLEKNGSSSIIWSESRPKRLVSYLSIDQEGNFYLSDYAIPQPGADLSGSILKISPDGMALDIIEGDGTVSLDRVFKLSISGNGTIYMTNGTGCIQAIYPDGGRSVILQAGHSNATEVRCIDVACGSDGYVYVSEMSDNRVMKLTADGALVAEWDGCGPDRFQAPYMVAAGSDGRVYVSDVYSKRIVWFDSNRYRFGANDSENAAGKGDLWGNAITDDDIPITGPPFGANNNGPNAIPGYVAFAAMAGLGIAGICLYLSRARRD